MITAGIVIFVVAALLEVSIYLRGAWPTGLTWALMAVGLVMIAAGFGRTRPRAARMAWLVLALFVLTLVLLWASG